MTPEYEEDTATLTIKKMSMDLDGDYKCVAQNSAGTTETIAKITVEGIDDLDKKNFQHKIVNIFLPMIFSISFGCSKEPSH